MHGRTFCSADLNTAFRVMVCFETFEISYYKVLFLVGHKKRISASAPSSKALHSQFFLFVQFMSLLLKWMNVQRGETFFLQFFNWGRFYEFSLKSELTPFAKFKDYKSNFCSIGRFEGEKGNNRLEHPLSIRIVASDDSASSTDYSIMSSTFSSFSSFMTTFLLILGWYRLTQL